MENHIPYNKKMLYARIGMLISSSLDIHEILEGIMTEVRQFFSPEHWSLMRHDHVTGELYFLFMAGEDMERLKTVRLLKGEGIAGTVAATGQSVFVPDVTKDSRFSDKVDRIINFQTRSVIAVPMICRGVVHGVIEIINSDKTATFSEDDHLALRTIADFSAIAMSNFSLHQKIVEQNTHDILTGLLSRRRLSELMDQWASGNPRQRRHIDSGITLAVIYMDIDNFKLVNDLYGHRQGDTALVEISGILRGIFRNDDYLFRIGGDEFLAIIRSENDELDQVTGRISQSLDAIRYTTADSGLTLAISYGISSGPHEKIESLVNEADDRMYRNKKAKDDSWISR